MTKYGYNLQIGTENQFIIDFGLFPNPTDTFLFPLIPAPLPLLIQYWRGKLQLWFRRKRPIHAGEWDKSFCQVQLLP